MDIWIYIYIYRCTFYKMFVCQVVLGLLRLSRWLLCQKVKGLWKGGREHIFNFCYLLSFFELKRKKVRPTACLNVDNQNSAFVLTVISCLFSYRGVREANRFAHGRVMICVHYVSPATAGCVIKHPPVYVSRISWTLPCSGRDWNACQTSQSPSFPSHHSTKPDLVAPSFILYPPILHIPFLHHSAPIFHSYIVIHWLLNAIVSLNVFPLLVLVWNVFIWENIYAICTHAMGQTGWHTFIFL